MKKTFVLEDLDCANCAAKMENAINKLDGVRHASVSFMTRKLVVEADDGAFDSVMENVKKVCRRIEPDCTIIM